MFGSTSTNNTVQRQFEQQNPHSFICSVSELVNINPIQELQNLNDINRVMSEFGLDADTFSKVFLQNKLQAEQITLQKQQLQILKQENERLASINKQLEDTISFNYQIIKTRQTELKQLQQQLESLKLQYDWIYQGYQTSLKSVFQRQTEIIKTLTRKYRQDISKINELEVNYHRISSIIDSIEKDLQIDTSQTYDLSSSSNELQVSEDDIVSEFSSIISDSSHTYHSIYCNEFSEDSNEEGLQMIMIDDKHQNIKVNDEDSIRKGRHKQQGNKTLNIVTGLHSYLEKHIVKKKIERYRNH